MGHKRLKRLIRLFIVMEITWEYKRIKYEFRLSSDLEDELNKEGKDGWEIVYYQETKPLKFGEKIKTIVLFKKIRQLQSG